MENSDDLRTALLSICSVLEEQIVLSGEMRTHLLAMMHLMRRELPAALESPPHSTDDALRQVAEIIQQLKA